jgi:hypothetical protein
LRFFSSRVSSTTYYSKITKDALVGAVIPPALAPAIRRNARTSVP